MKIPSHEYYRARRVDNTFDKQGKKKCRKLKTVLRVLITILKYTSTISPAVNMFFRIQQDIVLL